MTSILISAGFKYLESLKEFADRFPSISKQGDEDLDKILICHPNNPSDENGIRLTDEGNTENLLQVFLKRIDEKNEHERQMSFFYKLLDHFGTHLTNYIVRKCFLFYNWGWNSIEVITNYDYVHERIRRQCENKYVLSKMEVEQIQNSWGCPKLESDSLQNMPQAVTESENIVLADQNKVKYSQRHITYRAFIEAYRGMVPMKEIQDPKLRPLMNETFNLNKLLYDDKIRTRWSRNHILSTNNVKKLLEFIIGLDAKCSFKPNLMFSQECSEWNTYKQFLQTFIDNHSKVEKNNGYERILKKHLITGYTSTSEMTPISRAVVISYVLDVLRRVVPSNFYANNRMKKKFFSCIAKILNGGREQTFIWEPYVRVFLENQPRLVWCQDVKTTKTQAFIIVQTFKFLIVHYVFNVVKDHFYVTETGESNYGLRFYRKEDMKAATSFYFNLLVKQKQVKLFKKSDADVFSIERHWIDTGVIDGADVSRKAQVLMGEDTQFKQPVAATSTMYVNPDAECVYLAEKFHERTLSRQQKVFMVKLFLESLIQEFSTGTDPVPQNPKLGESWLKAIEMKRKFGRVYFVKADITNAFDSILHDKLLEVLKERIRESFGENKFVSLFQITEWCVVKGQGKKRIRLSFARKPQENSIICRREKCSEAHNIDEFVRIIRQVALQQRLEVNGKILKLSKGLAQGSAGKLSPHLCDIYYSWMDKSIFSAYLNSQDCILLRGVDDYLLITSDMFKAHRFLRIIRSGVPDFNVRFSANKFTTNLKAPTNEVRYLGLLLNFETMSVRPDYSKYQGVNILRTMKLSDSFGNVHLRRRNFFQRRMTRLSGVKLHPIFLRRYNSRNTIRESVFQACIMQSLRMMLLADHLFRGQDNLVVARALFRMCRRIKRLINAAGLVISKEDATWLFFQAVVMTFAKRSGQFRDLLRVMRFTLQRWERKMFSQRGKDLEELRKVHKNSKDFLYVIAGIKMK